VCVWHADDDDDEVSGGGDLLPGASTCSVCVQVIIGSCWLQKSQKLCDDWVPPTSVRHFYQFV